MGEATLQVPPFASPAEPAIGTFWAFPRGSRVPSVFTVIRKLMSAHPRGTTPRYATLIIGAGLVYALEQLLTDEFARCVVADFAWTAAAIGAIFGTARAVRHSRGNESGSVCMAKQWKTGILIKGGNTEKDCRGLYPGHFCKQ